MRKPIVGVACALLLATAGSGCALHKKKHHKFAMRGVPVIQDGSAVPVMEGPVVQRATFVDRHPLLSRPRDVYHNTHHGPIAKTAAATVVGVPVGVVHEVKQIVTGIPPATIVR